MKTKFIPMLAGAVVLTLAAVPFAVKAQSTDPSTPPATTQPQGHHRHHGGDMLLKNASQLGLTDTQIQQIQANDAAARAQIKPIMEQQIKPIIQATKKANFALLTSAQQAQVQQMVQQWKQNHSQGSTTTTTTTSTPQQ